MSALVINNQYVADFETDLSYKAVNAWNRTLKKLWWPRIMLLEPPSASAKRIVEWQLETARIHHLGPTGKDHVFDPILTASHEILYDHFGNALKLDKSQMSDNRFDKAPKWASDTGSAVVYFPQRLAAMLMKYGKVTTNPVTGRTLKAFDDGAFFRKTHPIGGTDNTYSNLHNGLSFTAENVAKVIAYAESIKHGGDAPASAVPSILIAPTNYRLRGTQITSAEWFTDILNGAASAAQNAFKMAFDFEPPIFAPELNDDAVENTWYLAVPADQDAFDGALGLWEREAFAMNTFQPASNWELAQRKEFIWENAGRIGAFYGLPYRLHRCEPSGSIDSYISAIDL
jgi:hypothetical protein